MTTLWCARLMVRPYHDLAKDGAPEKGQASESGFFGFRAGGARLSSAHALGPDSLAKQCPWKADGDAGLAAVGRRAAVCDALFAARHLRGLDQTGCGIPGWNGTCATFLSLWCCRWRPGFFTDNEEGPAYARYMGGNSRRLSSGLFIRVRCGGRARSAACPWGGTARCVWLSVIRNGSAPCTAIRRGHAAESRSESAASKEGRDLRRHPPGFSTSCDGFSAASRWAQNTIFSL